MALCAQFGSVSSTSIFDALLTEVLRNAGYDIEGLWYSAERPALSLMTAMSL